MGYFLVNKFVRKEVKFLLIIGIYLLKVIFISFQLIQKPS